MARLICLVAVCLFSLVFSLLFACKLFQQTLDARNQEQVGTREIGEAAATGQDVVRAIAVETMVNSSNLVARGWPV